MKLSIIIPVYNEMNTIQEILEKIEDLNEIKKQIIIVDDGSSDEALVLAPLVLSEDGFY